MSPAPPQDSNCGTRWRGDKGSLWSHLHKGSLTTELVQPSEEWGLHLPLSFEPGAAWYTRKDLACDP